MSFSAAHAYENAEPAEWTATEEATMDRAYDLVIARIIALVKEDYQDVIDGVITFELSDDMYSAIEESVIAKIETLTK